MFNIHLSCHKAHIISIAHFTQTLCNIVVHGQNVVPRGYKEEVVQTQRFLTHPHKKSHGGVSGRSGGHCSRGRSIFSTVSNQYQEMYTLGISGLCNRSEAEPHADGKCTCWRLCAAVGKTTP